MIDRGHGHTQAKIIQMTVLFFYLAPLERVYSLASNYEMVSVPYRPEYGRYEAADDY